MCCIVASDLAAAAFDAIFMRLCVFRGGGLGPDLGPPKNENILLEQYYKTFLTVQTAAQIV